VVTGVVAATLPAILGSKAAVLTFVSSESAGVTSVTVAAPGGGSLGQLFGLTISSFSLNVATGKWSVAGSATTSSGASSPFTGSLDYSGTTLTGGSLTVDAISLAGVLDLSKLTLTFAKGAWSGSATIAQQTHTAAVTFGFSAAGSLISGSITTGPITLFNALPLKSFAMTYTSGAWSLAASATTTGGGTLSASLAVSASGAVTGGSIQLAGGTVSMFSKITLTSLLLSYSTPGNIPTYTGAIGIQLPPPATVVSGVTGSLTMANGKFSAGSLEVTGNVPLADGLFLSQLGASVKAPTTTTGGDVCGSVGLTGGPTIGGSALIGVKGAIEYAFPATTGAGSYRVAGELTVPGFVIDGGVLGNLYMTIAPGSGKASFLVALGPGSAAGHCPVQSGPKASPGITLAKGIKVTGTLSGDVSATNFIVNGAATFTYPALFTGTVSGNVAIDSTDITACAAKSGSTGSYGFTLTWDGDFTTYSGNCPINP
jgi:cytoskeletal protein CcmA (bactofilin family)